MAKTPKKTGNNPLDRLLGELATKHLAVKKRDLSELPLFDFLVEASPVIDMQPSVRPLHLSPILPYLDAIDRGEPTFFCFSAPPRHGKSVTIDHYIARLMLRRPGVRIAIGSYGLELSQHFSDRVKSILVQNGVELDRAKNTKSEWRLANGSELLAVAPGSGFTGRGADLILIDDPFKNRQTAQSGKERQRIWDWVSTVCITRRSPTCSVIVNHTRWHIDDVIGRLSRDHGVPYVCLQAIDDDTGEALWPEEWSKERLVNEVKPFLSLYDWAALYQGKPVPLGGAVFSDPTFYSAKDYSDANIVRYIIGIDCAYTKKTSSDYSVAVVIAVASDKRAFVIDVRRKQMSSKAFGELLRELKRNYENAPIYWYVGGQEKVISEFFKDTLHLKINAVAAKEDKFARAQSVSAAWNSGRLLIPSDHTPWAGGFTTEVLNFTGQDDEHDDQVDALAAAWIPLARPKVPRGMASQPVVPF